MKRCWMGIALAVASIAAAPAYAQECGADDTYGTAVSWMKDVEKAGERARAEKRLLMVVHLSGELDNANKT